VKKGLLYLLIGTELQEIPSIQPLRNNKLDLREELQALNSRLLEVGTRRELSLQAL